MFSHQELIEELPGLKRFARKLSNSEADAEDLVQTTVLKTLENKEKFEDGTDLFKWGSKIMYNTFASGYKRKTKFETQYDPEPYIEKQTTKPGQEDALQLRQVDEAMKKLSTQHSEVIILVCVKGLKYKQVAAMLGVPVGTVRSRLSRAREQLQNLMEAK